MTPPEYPEHVSRAMCELRHKQVEQEIRRIKQDTEKINDRLWKMMIMIITQLLGVFGIILKGCSF